MLSDEKPWGLILFKRNIKSLKQIKKLVNEIRKFSKDKKFPILVDEEGGKVSRLGKIINHEFSQKLFGDLYKENKNLGLTFYKNYLKNIINLLKTIGININTVPVLDVLRNNTSKVIDNRSFSNDPLIVKKLGQACVNFYKSNKIGTVIKHVPGHGCATADSHFKTPLVNLNYKDLDKYDFFRLKKSIYVCHDSPHYL